MNTQESNKRKPIESWIEAAWVCICIAAIKVVMRILNWFVKLLKF